MAAWAELHADIIALILKKITDIEDFIAFEFVCRWWRQVARNKRYLLRPQIPRLVPRENEDNIGYRRIYNVVSGETKSLCAPELSGRTKCIGLKHGWILTIFPKGEVNLVNPLSRSRIELPPLTSLEKMPPPYHSMSCAELSANPSETSDFAVIIEDGFVIYWRPGDKRWRILEDKLIRYKNLIYYRDQLYTISNFDIFACKIPHDGSSATFRWVTSVKYSTEVYMVESGDALLLLDQTLSWRCGTTKFDVYELDLKERVRRKQMSLGNRAIFVGRNTSISFDVSEYPDSIKSNHIYFVDGLMEDDKWVSSNIMGSYNLEDGKITYIKVVKPWSAMNPPFWFIPSF